MNAKNDRWESYTDRAGRRHWRWPACSEPNVHDGRDVDADSQHDSAVPAPRQEMLAEGDAAD